jgi:CheY-like chemotaxis protein
VSADDTTAELRVADTGQGIDPAFLPRVFDRFCQSDASTTRAHGGLGLGLAIVRHIVELHGGTVDAASDGPGRGACSRVRLPLAPHDLPGRPAAATTSASPATLTSPPDLTGLHILIVDDDADTRELLVGALEHCHALATADEALDHIRQAPPHVLVSDIAMPGEDGYSLIRKLRALPPAQGGRIPTIALVAGFDRHVAKPIEPTDLLITLANLCDRLPFA